MRLPGARLVRYVLAGLLALLGATPAWAQLAASVSANSEDKYRGHSVSGGHPVAAIDLSYDHASGVYLGGSGTAVFTASGAIEPLLLQTGIGYARQITAEKTLDFGFTRSDYSRYSINGLSHYDEVYAGVVIGDFASHIFYSPDYFRSGLSTIYVDADRTQRLAKEWRATFHGGMIAQLTNPLGRRLQYDWRVGISRQLQSTALQAGLTSGGPGADFAGGRPRHRT